MSFLLCFRTEVLSMRFGRDPDWRRWPEKTRKAWAACMIEIAEQDELPFDSIKSDLAWLKSIVRGSTGRVAKNG